MPSVTIIANPEHPYRWRDELLDFSDRSLVQIFVELDCQVLLRYGDSFDGLTAQLRATQTQHEWHGVAVADRLGDVLAQRSHAPSGRGVVSDKEVDLVRMGTVKLVCDLGDREAST